MAETDNDFSSKIEQSRAAGATDEQILGFLGQSDSSVASKIAQSQAANIGSADILKFLSASGGAKPKLTPRTPKETSAFLQERYGDILKQPSDPSVFGAREVLKGAGKQLLRGQAEFATMGQDPGAHPLITPEGPGQELGASLLNVGQLASGAIQSGAAGIAMLRKLVQQPGGLKKLQLAYQLARHPVKTTILRALEELMPEEAEKLKRPGLKPPKYGGPTEPFDEGASRLRPRKPAINKVKPAEEPPFEKFKPSASVKRKMRYGGPIEPFDEGASRPPPKRLLNKAKQATGEVESGAAASPSSTPREYEKPPSSETRDIGRNRLEADRVAKDDTIAKYFIGKKVKPEDVLSMPASELETHFKLAGKYRLRQGGNLSRGEAAVRADIYKRMMEILKMGQ